MTAGAAGATPVQLHSVLRPFPLRNYDVYQRLHHLVVTTSVRRLVRWYLGIGLKCGLLWLGKSRAESRSEIRNYFIQIASATKGIEEESGWIGGRF